MAVNINLGLTANAGGTVDVITATYSPAVTSLTDRLVLIFRATGANTSTTPTFSPNGLTARTIVKKGGQALAAGDIAGNRFQALVMYDLANTRWELLNPATDLADTFWEAGAGTNSLKDKRSTTGSGDNGFTAGDGAVNSGINAQAIGAGASNTSEGAQAIGESAQNSGHLGQAIGEAANNSGDNGQAIGRESINAGEDGQAIGSGANNGFARSTALGYNSVTTADDQANISGTLRLQDYAGAGTNLLQIDNDGIVSAIKHPEVIAIACSDLTSNLTTGTSKGYVRMPFAMTLTSVRASVIDAPTGASLLTVDINEAGVTILSTKITIDASEKTSTTAATAPVISDSALADDAEITIDIDQIGSTNAGKGLIVYLIGTRT